MRTHLFVSATCGIILLGGLYVIVRSSQMDDSRNRLQSEKAARITLDQNIAQRETRIQELEQGNSTLQAKRGEMELLNSERDKAKQRLDAAKTQVTTLQAELKTVQQALRESSDGKNLGTIALKNGTKLENATVKKVKMDGISFIHSTGIQMIPSPNLPDEIVERFGLIAPVAQPVLDPDEAAPPSSSFSTNSHSTKSSPSLPGQVDSKKDLVRGMQESINGLQEQYNALKYRYNTLRSQAQSKWSDHYSARAMGKISAHSVQATQYDRQAEQLATQMNALASQIETANRTMRQRERER